MSSSVGSRAQKILIVDGDVRSSERLASLLREDGFEVEVARDAAAARSSLHGGVPPDTLLTELDIPNGDAGALARQARVRRAGLRVVVVTRFANALRAADFGTPAPCLLPKPLDYARLLEVLRSDVVCERPPSEAPVASSRL